MEKKTGGVHTM